MRSTERARQILDVAKRVFAERGFHAANISHICEACGIGRGTLYQYFPNKKSVFTAILRETLDNVRALMERQVVRRFPRPEQLSRAQVIEFIAQGLRQLLGVVFADEHTLRILLREAVGLDMEVERLLGEIDDVVIGLCEVELARACDAGILRPLDPRITATLIVGAVEKAALRALRGDTPVDLDALAREAALLHGVGTLSDRVKED